jgi:hypothetical protein
LEGSSGDIPQLEITDDGTVEESTESRVEVNRDFEGFMRTGFLPETKRDLESNLVSQSVVGSAPVAVARLGLTHER